jgi:hypothetical protein
MSLEASAHSCAVSGVDNVIMHCSIDVGVAPADSPQVIDPPEEGLEPFATTEPHGSPFVVEPTANTPLSGGAHILFSLGVIIISALGISFSF